MFQVTEEDHTLSYILNSTLTIIHNVSLIDSNIPYLRKYNFTEALQPYLKSKDKDEHLTALAGLAAIINEEESDIINSNRKVVKHLMKVLRRALRESDRRYEGWSCKELAFGEYTIRHMSRGMRFPTMWHFDMCRLRRASATYFYP